MKHRILHIISDLAHGGTQRQTALVAAGLPRDEFDVEVASLGGGGPMAEELARDGVAVAALGRRSDLDPGTWWKLGRLIVALRPQLVHLWQGDGVGPLAAITAISTSAAHLILTQRKPEPPSGLVGSFLQRSVARRAAFIVATCRTGEHALGQQGWPVEEQLLIADGVPATQTPTCARRELLNDLKISENARLLITVGPLTRAKRIKDLIWATDMLKFFRDDVHLLIVGDGPHRARFERFRAQCEIEDKVHFLGDRADVPRLLQHCDVFLSACGLDYPSIAILEAMMAGLPVVAVDTPVNRELVALGETGFLVPLGDRNQFARCAHKLTTDSDLRQRIAEASRRRAIEHFSSEQTIARYVALYRQVLAGK